MTHRTLRNPGPQMSQKEQLLRNALAELQIAMSSDNEARIAMLNERIASLRAEIDRPAKVRRVTGNIKESDILKAVLAYLRHCPKVARVWRQNSGTFAKQYGDKTHYIKANTAHGMTDIAGVLRNGKSIFIEVKTPTGIIAPHQQEFIDSMKQAGAVAGIVRSLDDVINFMKGV